MARALAPDTALEQTKEDEFRALLRRVRRVELKTRRALQSHGQGAYLSRFKGRGMAFSESRAYIAGDDPRHIDWNVSARTGELFVKQFVEERELLVWLAVDVSGSQAFGSRVLEKRQLAAEAAALLAFSALRNHDKVGLLLYSDRVERVVLPRAGRSHVLRLLRDVLAFVPASTGTDPAAALSHLNRLTKKRAIVAWISDFLPGTEAQRALPAQAGRVLEAPLRVLCRRHDVLALQIADPLESALPDVGLVCVRDPESGRSTLVDTSSPRVRAAFAERVAAEEERLSGLLSRVGAERVTLTTHEDASRALVRFLERRARRAR